MAATQTPPSPPERPQEPVRDSTRARYEYYEHHELLSVIDDLEDERAKARVREGIWISLILHLLFFWFISYGPHVLFHRPYVVSPLTALAKREKQLTFLNLPPDQLKPQKPKRSDIISDKDRVAQSAHPTLDKKTLEELQAMQRAGKPAPPPQPAQQAQNAPQPQPQQQALPAAPAPQSQATPPPQQEAQLNMPSAPRPDVPRNQNPNQNRAQPAKPTMSVNEMIRSAEQAAARQSDGNLGNNGDNAPDAHPGMQSGVEVLSDTMGVDFGPYLRQVIQATQNSWDILIPESARAPLLKKGKVAIQFMIMPDGTVQQMQLIGPSGDVSLDKAAWGGILGASPFPPLPKQFKGPYLALRFYFLYNERPGGN
jgi:TonB family protein